MDQFKDLTSEQQRVFEEVGAGLQNYAYKASEEDDERVEKEFEKAGVNVAQMDSKSFAEWQKISEPIWGEFAEDVEGGQKLISLARKV